MSGKRRFHERCVCGAEIDMLDEFEMIGLSRIFDTFEQWQKQHGGCLSLFQQVQNAKLKQLTEVSQ